MTKHNVNTDLDAAQQLLEDKLSNRIKGGNSSSCCVVGDFSYPYSCIRVLKVCHDGVAKSYFLKRIIPGSGTLERARTQLIRESEILIQLKSVMYGQVVSLVAVFPAQTTIVTAQCDGIQFDQLISDIRKKWYSRHHRALLLQGAFACGTWLHRFQDLTHYPDCSLGEWLKFQMGEIEWRVELLVHCDPDREALYRELSAKLRDELRTMRLDSRSCQIHGDFAPHNIFLTSDGQIQVLDFFATRVGHPTADVVNCIGKIASMAESVWFPTSLAKDMCERFLAAYGAMEPDDSRVFGTLLALQCLKRLVVLSQASEHKRNLRFFVTDRSAWYISFIKNYLSAKDWRILERRSPWPFLDPLGVG